MSEEVSETLSVSSTAAQPGTFITFYSYKGGAGRSMAVANVGCLLAEGFSTDELSSPDEDETRLTLPPKRILLIDWDLDAPGLHYFFGPATTGSASDQKPGLIELFHEIRTSLRRKEGQAGSADAVRAVMEEIAIEDFIVDTGIPSLSIMKAGRFDDSYFARVRRFPWKAFYQKAPQAFPAFIEMLAAEFRYVLVDSRTGESDIGGICTAILPEKLVLVFTPSAQSMNGLLDVARRAVAFRKQADDLRPLALFPLPSRIDLSEPALHDAWRIGNLEEGIDGYQPLFESLLRDVYSLPECNLQGYFSEIQIQHIPAYAYGEKIAALVERKGGRLTLRRSYETFAGRLANLSVPWSLKASERRGASPFRIPAGRPLAGPMSQGVEPIELAEEISRARDMFLLRSTIRQTRTYLEDYWPRQITELTADAKPRTGITENEVYDVCIPHIKKFENDASLTETLGLALADAEQAEAVRELMAVVEGWISISERPAPGDSIMPIRGAPGICALRALVNWGAKAANNNSVDVLKVILTHPLSTEGEGRSGTTSPLVDRVALFFPEAMLGRADLAVKYIEESWTDPGVEQLFAGRQDHRDGVAKVLFLTAVIWNARNPEDVSMSRPFYPGFKLIEGSERAIRTFLLRIPPPLLAFLASESGETVDAFRNNWPDRREVLAQAGLGHRYFGSGFSLPSSI